MAVAAVGVGGAPLLFQMPRGIRLMRSESLWKETGPMFLQAPQLMCGHHQCAAGVKNHWFSNRLLMSKKPLSKSSAPVLLSARLKVWAS